MKVQCGMNITRRKSCHRISVLGGSKVDKHVVLSSNLIVTEAAMHIASKCTVPNEPNLARLHQGRDHNTLIRPGEPLTAGVGICVKPSTGQTRTRRSGETRRTDQNEWYYDEIPAVTSEVIPVHGDTQVLSPSQQSVAPEV